MPYQTISELPKRVKRLPEHAKEIYKSAFNAAYEQYKDREDREAVAHAVAWTAVKTKYKKQGSKWVPRESLFTHRKTRITPKRPRIMR